MDADKKDWMSLSDHYIMHTYGRSPVTLVEGKGCRVFDSDGKMYLDFLAGIAVCSLGHAHPEVAEAVCRQAQKLVHVSNLYYTVPQIELAESLIEHSFADRVFFCNSGAEANEAAIKLARKYSRDHFGDGRYEVICLQGSFHGRTLAALSATGQEKFHKGFEPLMDGFRHVPAGDLEAMKQAITGKTCAILMEPIQGEGGVVLFSPEYLPAVRKLCDEHRLLLILDEVQVGMGRTGTLFAHEHYGIKPDMMTLAKALANGLPLGALLAREEVAASFTPGTHASTFGGNPVVCAAANVVLKTLLEGGLLSHCREMGGYFKQGLEGLAARYPSLIKEVRGLGLILGLGLMVDGADFVTGLLHKGFLINCTQGNILRFAPPLIITREEVDLLIVALDEECRNRL
ncbi:MAG: acetylornithine transaminase [Thermodesulfobacteriota bacterium]